MLNVAIHQPLAKYKIYLKFTEVVKDAQLGMLDSFFSKFELRIYNWNFI